MAVFDPHDLVKAMLAIKGTSLTGIAESLGVAPATVTIVSKGHRRSRKIEAALAAAVGVTPAQLWPDRYPEQKKGAR